MKLVIERNKLLPVLSSVMGAIARKTTLPVLGCVHVMGDGEALHLTGTDLETTIQSTVRGIAHTPFNALWPAKRMMDIVKSYPEDGLIGIAQDDPEKLTVKCGRSRFSLQTLDPDDYPLIDENHVFDHNFIISEERLRSCLSKIDFAMAHQDVRYYLNGLLFHGHDQRVDFIATDGHRLANTHQDLDVSFDEEWQSIIPADAITEIKRACNRGECTVSVCKNMVRFVFSGERTLIVKQIDGRFPDYQRVVPRDFSKQVILDRSAFLEAVQRIHLVLDNTQGVELHLTDGTLELGGGSGNDRAEDQIDATYSGDELIIGMSSRYLIDVLRTIESEVMELHCNGYDGAIKLLNPDRPEDVYVIMPMRL